VTDRIPSDHDAIDSHRVHISTVGRTRRRQVVLPTGLECSLDDLVFVSLEGEGRHAAVTANLNSEPTLQDAFVTRQLARTQGGDDELGVWLDDNGLTDGDPLILDILRTGYAYGLRRPGERVVYSPPEPPDSTLQDIADSLDE
jgi:hypothetical protein